LGMGPVERAVMEKKQEENSLQLQLPAGESSKKTNWGGKDALEIGSRKGSKGFRFMGTPLRKSAPYARVQREKASAVAKEKCSRRH